MSNPASVYSKREQNLLANYIDGVFRSETVPELEDRYNRTKRLKSTLSSIMNGLGLKVEVEEGYQMFARYIQERKLFEAGQSIDPKVTVFRNLFKSMPGGGGSGGGGSGGTIPPAPPTTKTTTTTSGTSQSPFEKHLSTAFYGSTPSPFIDQAVPAALRNIYGMWAKILHPDDSAKIDDALSELLSSPTVTKKSLEEIYNTLFISPPTTVPKIDDIQKVFSFDDLKDLGANFKDKANQAIVLENAAKTISKKLPGLSMALLQTFQKDITNSLSEIEAGILRIHLNCLKKSSADIKDFKLGGNGLRFYVINHTSKTMTLPTKSTQSFTEVTTGSPDDINTIELQDGHPSSTAAPDDFMKKVYTGATQNSLFHPGFFGIVVS